MKHKIWFFSVIKSYDTDDGYDTEEEAKQEFINDLANGNIRIEVKEEDL